MFIDQLRASVEAAQSLSSISSLETSIWKTAWPNHINDVDAQQLADILHCKRKALLAAQAAKVPLGFTKPRAPRITGPKKVAAIERRRRLARASPVPPELVDQFTQGEHAVITVVAGEIQRAGRCDWCLDRIAAIAGVCKTLVRNAMRKGRAVGLLFSLERRRAGQKSLTNVVRALRQSWGAWLKRVGCRKLESTTDRFKTNGSNASVERLKETMSTPSASSPCEWKRSSA
jgi:hypothetical protein